MFFLVLQNLQVETQMHDQSGHVKCRAKY